MSDEPKKPSVRHELFKTSGDDFIRFLGAKTGKSDPCQVCGTDNWVIFCDSEDVTNRFGTMVRNAEKQYYISSFAYSCTNCGYMRHHLARVVHDWVKANPAPDSEVEAEEPSKDE